MSIRKKSPLWNHFEEVEGNISSNSYLCSYFLSIGDFRQVLCNHCVLIVKRGKEGEVRSKCINKEMQAHLILKGSSWVRLCVRVCVCLCVTFFLNCYKMANNGWILEFKVSKLPY